MIRKTEPTSMFEGLAAGLQSQAAVGLFPIGLISQLKIIAEGFACRMIFNVARASWIKSSLILLVAGLWCIQLHGATNHGVTNVFETPPPQIGSIQWEKIQRLAKERQELYRKQVSVPGAVAEDVPRAEGANFIGSRKIMTAETQPASVSSGMFRKILFFVVVLALI